MQPAVAVGMGAAAVAVLKLPLPAVVIATLLTTKAGPGLEPLIIVGVVVSYIVTLLIVLYEPTYAPMLHPSTPRANRVIGNVGAVLGILYVSGLTWAGGGLTSGFEPAEPFRARGVFDRARG